MQNKIRSFTDLTAWKVRHEVVLKVYNVTQNFPQEEIFGLTSQMRRSVVSITSNLAEGFSRVSYKDKIHFYTMALGSVTELQNQLLISRDISYISANEFEKIYERLLDVQKIICGLIRSSRLK